MAAPRCIEFEQIEHGSATLDLAGLDVHRLSVADQRDASDLAAGIELDPQWLQHAIRDSAVHQPDGERREAMHPRPVPVEQQPSALLRARHQRLATPVEHEYGHFHSFTAAGEPPGRYCCPYGPCDGRLAATLPSTMLQRSFGLRLAADRFVAPAPCLHLLLPEPQTEEASAGGSRTSLQRSGDGLPLGLVSQNLQSPESPSPSGDRVTYSRNGSGGGGT